MPSDLCGSKRGGAARDSDAHSGGPGMGGVRVWEKPRPTRKKPSKINALQIPIAQALFTWFNSAMPVTDAVADGRA